MFRLSKYKAREIIDHIAPHARQVRRISGVPLHTRVLAAMHFLGHGSFQKAVGLCSWTNMSQPLISRSINEVCQLITEHLLQVWVKFPTSDDDERVVKLGFYEEWGMRDIIGAIDGTHVEIIAPPRTDVNHPPFVYINTKGRHSINVMLICDSKQNILAVDARYPGSVHDAAIFRTSAIRNHLRQRYTEGYRNSYLIGDSGYGSEPWLLTPFLNTHPNTPEERYNAMLTSARNVIERTNGILKRRFCSLSRHRVLVYHPSKAAYIIYTAAVFHNMAVQENIPIHDDHEDAIVEVEEVMEEREIEIGDVANLGRQARADYILRNM